MNVVFFAETAEGKITGDGSSFRGHFRLPRPKKSPP